MKISFSPSSLISCSRLRGSSPCAVPAQGVGGALPWQPGAQAPGAGSGGCCLPSFRPLEWPAWPPSAAEMGQRSPSQHYHPLQDAGGELGGRWVAAQEPALCLPVITVRSQRHAGKDLQALGRGLPHVTEGPSPGSLSRWEPQHRPFPLWSRMAQAVRTAQPQPSTSLTARASPTGIRHPGHDGAHLAHRVTPSPSTLCVPHTSL